MTKSGRNGGVLLSSQAPRAFPPGENKDGTYLADGALVMFPNSSEDLSTWMRRAHACRATSATEVGFGKPSESKEVIPATNITSYFLNIHFYPFEQMFFHDFRMTIDRVQCHFPRLLQANDVSSRSHAVCMLRLQSGGGWKVTLERNGGFLK